MSYVHTVAKEGIGYIAAADKMSLGSTAFCLRMLRFEHRRRT